MRNGQVAAYRMLVVTALTGMLSAPLARAENAHFRILYAEPVQVRPADLAPSSTAKQAGAARLSFQALGRQFELELSPNERLLSALPAEQRRRLDAYRLYRGRVVGHEHSWVRLLAVGDQIQGAIWDGTELYTIAPLAETARFLDVPVDSMLHGVAGEPLLIYRLSDTLSDRALGFCDVLEPQRDTPSLLQRQPHEGRVSAPSPESGLRGYLKLVSELQTQLAADPTKQIEIAAIADVEMNGLLSSDTQGGMLARINIVDGIYSEQVGVAIMVGELRIFTAEPDPFTTNDPEALLNQVADLRFSTPAIRSRGLAHLITGRTLTGGDVAGIAFTDVLCDPRFGVSLSDGTFDLSTTARIMAHELGHNFGAPHDGEGACASTPPLFLMAPIFNGSDQFSTCSLNQMRPNINAAACITPAHFPDVTPTAEAARTVLHGDPVQYDVTVSSIGSGTANDVVVTSDFFQTPLLIDGATFDGGSCSVSQLQVVTCQRASLAAGANAHVHLNVRFLSVGLHSVRSTVTASGERQTSNNSVLTNFTVQPAVDVALEINPTSITTLTRQPFSFDAITRSLGPRSASSVHFAFGTGSAVEIQGASTSAGTCSTTASLVSCELGDMAAGESRIIHITAIGRIAEHVAHSAEVTATNESAPLGSSGGENNHQRIDFFLTSAADLAPTPAVSSLIRPVNETFTYSVVVSSIGSVAATNAVVTLFHNATFVIESASVGGRPCTITAASAVCSIGDLVNGQSRTIDLQAHVTIVSRIFTSFVVAADNDDNVGNNQGEVQLDIRNPVDVEQGQLLNIGGVETLPIQGTATITSRGVLPATNVRVVVQVSAPVALDSGTLAGNSCTGQGSELICTLSALAPNATANVQFVMHASDIGDFPITVTAAADGDAVPSNGTRVANVHVSPFRDVRLLPVAPIAGFTDETFAFSLNVQNAQRPIRNVTVVSDLTDGLLGILSATPSTGSCTLDFAGRLQCQLGDLAPQQSERIDLQVSVATAVTRAFTFAVSSPEDLDPGNNSQDVPFTITPPPDASVHGPVSLRLDTDVDFDLNISAFVLGPLPVHDTVLDVHIPSALLIRGMSTTQGTCSMTATGVQCVLGTLAANAPVDLLLNLRTTVGGNFPITSELTASDDHVLWDNTSRTDVAVIAAAPPPPPPPPSDGGGGGGAFTLWSLLTLLGGLTVTRSRPAGPWRRPAFPAARSLH